MSYGEYYEQDDYNKKLRQGFVTVFLIIGIVLNVIAILMFFLGQELLQKTADREIPQYMFYVMALCAVVKILGIVFILKWKKLGFWIFALGAAGTFGTDAYTGFEDPQKLISSIFGLLGIGVLFLVLQIRKFGTSAWEHLE